MCLLAEDATEKVGPVFLKTVSNTIRHISEHFDGTIGEDSVSPAPSFGLLEIAR